MLMDNRVSAAVGLEGSGAAARAPTIAGCIAALRAQNLLLGMASVVCLCLFIAPHKSLGIRIEVPISVRNNFAKLIAPDILTPVQWYAHTSREPVLLRHQATDAGGSGGRFAVSADWGPR